jgi:hypothetical protein
MCGQPSNPHDIHDSRSRHLPSARRHELFIRDVRRCDDALAFGGVDDASSINTGGDGAGAHADARRVPDDGTGGGADRVRLLRMRTS